LLQVLSLVKRCAVNFLATSGSFNEEKRKKRRKENPFQLFLPPSNRTTLPGIYIYEYIYLYSKDATMNQDPSSLDDNDTNKKSTLTGEDHYSSVGRQEQQQSALEDSSCDNVNDGKQFSGQHAAASLTTSSDTTPLDHSSNSSTHNSTNNNSSSEPSRTDTSVATRRNPILSINSTLQTSHSNSNATNTVMLHRRRLQQQRERNSASAATPTAQASLDRETSTDCESDQTAENTSSLLPPPTSVVHQHESRHHNRSLRPPSLPSSPSRGGPGGASSEVQYLCFLS